jgi:hypothetical protein
MPWRKEERTDQNLLMNPGVLNPRAVFPAKFQALRPPEIATLQAGKILL